VDFDDDNLPADLGDFRVIKIIGEGGMGTVYEAVQTKLDRRVALKVLARRLAKDPTFLERFHREAKAAAAINHPNLVQVYDIGEDGGAHFFAMEYVEGENLSQRIKRDGRLDVPEALEIIEKVADALQEAHAQSIIHRDVKPENILITTGGRVKLADLGLAKILAEDTSVTMTGVGMGSPFYMAPEQAEDASHVDHRADIYSLGITFLTLLSGRRPFEGTSPFAIVRAHQTQPLPTGIDLGISLAKPVENLIQRLAAKKPEDRFQSYAEILTETKQVREQLDLPSAPAEVVSVHPSPAPFYVADTNISQGEFKTAVPVEKNTVSLRKILIGLALLLLGLFIYNYAPSISPTSAEAEQKNQSTNNNGPIAASTGTNAVEQAGTKPSLTPDDEVELLEAFLGPRPNRRAAPPIPERVIGLLMPSREATRYYRLPMGDPIRTAPKIFMMPQDGQGMMSNALTYARENPGDFRGNMIRFLQVYSRSTDRLRKPALAQIDQWSSRLEDRIEQEISHYTTKMQELLKADMPDAAYAVWKDFPRELNTFKFQPQIYGIISTNISRANLPRTFGYVDGPPGFLLKKRL
jgi:serine/threonine protein kinase